MSEKLVIKNFGPIKHVELELKKFNVLIGDNATGKSTVAKVLAVCRYFSYIIDGSSYSFYDSFEKGLYDRGMGEMIQDKSYIFYECDNYTFSTQRSTRKVPARDQENGEEYEYEQPCFDSKLIAKSERFRNLLNELKKIEPNGYQILNDFERWIPTSFYQNDVARVMDDPFFLPTERGLQSIFSLGKSSIQNLSESLFNQLADLDRIARLFKAETSIEPLNIIYRNENGRGYVKKESESQFYSLFNAATGYQSTIPVVLIVKYYTDIIKKRKTFIIEEPELNLFPNAQSNLVNYLIDKTVNYNNQILLTTHSPYILTSLNNLMYAYKVGQNNKEEVKPIIEAKCWLNPDEVSAYQLLADGKCENIIDEEEGLIKAEKIDVISGTLNEQFDALLSIEFAKA